MSVWKTFEFEKVCQTILNLIPYCLPKFVNFGGLKRMCLFQISDGWAIERDEPGKTAPAWPGLRPFWKRGVQSWIEPQYTPNKWVLGRKTHVKLRYPSLITTRREIQQCGTSIFCVLQLCRLSSRCKENKIIWHHFTRWKQFLSLSYLRV